MVRFTFKTAVRLSLLAVAFIAFGCSSVHTDAQNSPMVGAWIGGTQEQHQLACAVLRDRGVNASIDDKGVVVTKDDEMKARNVILTDARLKDSGLFVFAFVRAGTGQVTDHGFVAEIIEPEMLTDDQQRELQPSDPAPNLKYSGKESKPDGR